MSDHDELKNAAKYQGLFIFKIKMLNFFPTFQPLSLRLKIVKFTGLQVPTVQSGVAYPFCKRVAIPGEVWTSPLSQVAHLL
jgi:hypothetical protein